MTTISTNDKRWTINEWVNLNQARDFSDLWAGNIYGYSFIDNKDFLQVSFSWGKTFLSRGWVFVKYNKSNEPFTWDNNDEWHRMKCELTANTIWQTLSGEGYLYVEVVAWLTDTWSTQFDGKDYFDIKFDTVAPTVWPHIWLLYKINGTTGAIIEDYRKYRVGKFESLDVKTITLNWSDLTTTINTINSDISNILSWNVPAWNISKSFTAWYNAIKWDIVRLWNILQWENINKFYKASWTIGSTNPTTYENILWVITTDTAIDTVWNIIRYWLVKNVYTWLTSWKSYFLQANWTIGLIPSTSLIKIWDSISSTELYIYTSLWKEEDKVTYWTTQTAFDSWATQYFWWHVWQSYIKALGIKTNKQWAYRISCITWVENWNYNQASVKLYINSIFIQQIDLAYWYTVGTLMSFNDIYINNWDIIELYTKNIQAQYPWNNERSWVKNLKLTYDNFTTAYIA